MRAFLLATVFVVAIFNCFLGYSGAVLSYQVARSANHSGIEPSAFSQFVFSLQPWFYLLAVCALIVGALGLKRKLSESQLTCLVVLFLVIDVLGLLASTWGFGTVHFLL